MAYVKIHQWPYGKIPFILRDDDISYFTRPKMIEQLYAEAWDLGCPVSLSVIPKCSSAIPSDKAFFGERTQYDPLIPPDSRGRGESFPIDTNEELCSFLRTLVTERKVHVMQHGLTHEKINGKGEFEHPNKQLLVGRLSEGEEILKRAGLQANVFVPPFEKISLSGWKAISSRFGFSFTAGRVHVTPFYPLPFYRLSFSKFLRELRMGYARSHFLNMYRGFLILRNCGSPFHLDRDPDELLSHARERLKADIANQNPSIWVSHYWEWFFDWSDGLVFTDHLARRNQFLRLALSLPVWPATVADMMQWRRSFCGLRIRRVGSTMKVVATHSVPAGLTFLGKGKVQSSSQVLKQDSQRVVLGNIEEGEKIVIEMG